MALEVDVGRLGRDINQSRAEAAACHLWMAWLSARREHGATEAQVNLQGVVGRQISNVSQVSKYFAE